jgi:AcrR family transcriptional regulator
MIAMTMDSPLTESPTVAPGRGRPRDPEADENILSAARTLLAKNGFEAMSFEAIAQMTGVTRPTIYRRWPTKAHLANEIANGNGRDIPDVVETEGLRAQILAFLAQLMHQYERPEMGAANAGLIVSYQRNPELRDELHTPLESKARADLAKILRKARSRGLIRPAVDPDALFVRHSGWRGGVSHHVQLSSPLGNCR